MMLRFVSAKSKDKEKSLINSDEHDEESNKPDRDQMEEKPWPCS
jgi:hypothetical protein